MTVAYLLSVGRGRSSTSWCSPEALVVRGGRVVGVVHALDDGVEHAPDPPPLLGSGEGEDVEAGVLSAHDGHEQLAAVG